MTQIDEQRSRRPVFTGAQIFPIAADKCEQRHRIQWTYDLHGSRSNPHPMIACVIHGAEELKIENHPEPRPQDGESSYYRVYGETGWIGMDPAFPYNNLQTETSSARGATEIRGNDPTASLPVSRIL